MNPFFQVIAKKKTGGGGGGGPLVAHGFMSGAGGSAAINTTGANLIVICAGGYGGLLGGQISDSKSNSWTQLTHQLEAGAMDSSLFYCFSPTVGSGHTFDNGDGNPCLSIAAFSGMSASPFDVENGAVAGGAWTTLQPGSVTPSQAHTISVAGIVSFNQVSSLSINNSYTITDTVNPNPGVNVGCSLAYKVLTTATAQNPTWTYGTSQDGGANLIATFKY